jgi:hypothetical protein
MNPKHMILLAGAIVALALAGGAAGLLAATGNARTAVHHVRQGESIQAAIDAAGPGDTIVVAPGVYRENLTIHKDGLTLRGAGSGANGTVLQMPGRPHESPCTEDGGVNGICIAGEFVLGSDDVGTPVRSVRVSGVRVRDFTRFGVVVYNAVDTTVADTDVANSTLWGVAAFAVQAVRFEGDGSHGNGEGGFYVGDSAEANAVLTGNRAYGNATSEGIGIFVRDASHGVVRDNLLEGNCAGLIAVDTATDGAVVDWRITGNTVRRNAAACPPSGDIPIPLSGVGVAALGTARTAIRENLVEGNRPTADAPFSGGIVLGSSASYGGVDPSDTSVRGNTARGNAPADLLSDGTGEGNVVVGNRCGTSVPDGLCK